MGKTLIICDSTCDLNVEQEKKYKVRIVNCGVELDGLPYKERVEIDSARIYEWVAETGNLPHHSQITVMEFVEEYMRAARDGYTDILCVTMNSEGSGTHSAAIHAITLLQGEYPALEGKINIRVIDSGTYSVGITNGILIGTKLLEKGEAADVAGDAMEDYFKHQLTFVGLYNLQYAKKSGRLNAATAIVGEALGIKPIMAIKGYNKVFDKVRGDKNLIPKLAQLYFDNAADPLNGDYSVAYGDDLDSARQFVSAVRKLGAKAPSLIAPIGTCVAINAGPKMLGIAFRTKGE